MILVNGADGIGTGWMTKIPNFNPREIVSNLLRMLEGEEPVDMVPWFKNFRGTIAKLGHQKYVCNGEVSTLGRDRVEITELPVRVWTTGYREDLEKMVTGDEKTGPAQIQEFKDYNTDMTVRMVVKMEPEKLMQAEQGKGLHSFFKLQTTMSTTSMVLFDHMGCLRTYETVEEILKEFFTLRLDYYGKRKAFMEGLLGAEAAKLSNQARFILEKCKGTLKIENKKKKEMIEDLVRKKFDSDPVKEWKKSLAMDQEEEVDPEEDSQEVAAKKVEKGPDYDYLLGMPMWNLTQEKIDEICKKRDDKQQELKELQATTKEDLWQTDLKEFSDTLDEVEQKETNEANEGGGGGGGEGAEARPAGKVKGKGKAKGKPMVKADTLPSKDGQRIEPRVGEELKDKVVKAAAAKAKKAIKKEEGKTGVKVETKDEFDAMADDKLGVRKRIASGDKTKQSKLPFKPAAKPKKERNPWSDEDEEEHISGGGCLLLYYGLCWFLKLA